MVICSNTILLIQTTINYIYLDSHEATRRKGLFRSKVGYIWPLDVVMATYIDGLETSHLKCC